MRRYLDKGDRNSTSNLRKHAKVCWGDETVAAADATRDIDAAREILIKSNIRDGILSLFNPFLTFNSNTQRRNCAWVAESKRPFSTVKDVS